MPLSAKSGKSAFDCDQTHVGIGKSYLVQRMACADESGQERACGLPSGGWNHAAQARRSRLRRVTDIHADGAGKVADAPGWY
jgi:hypothetical protein